jgi:LiaF transmembrane domain
MTRQARRDTLVWGFLLIVIGFVFLLDTLNVEVWDSVARLWPLILIVWGGWKLYFGIKEKNEAAKTRKPDEA